jgi:hypothetical protein
LAFLLHFDGSFHLSFLAFLPSLFSILLASLVTSSGSAPCLPFQPMLLLLLMLMLMLSRCCCC